MLSRKLLRVTAVASLLLLLAQPTFTQDDISFFDYICKYNQVEVTIEASLKGILKKKDKYLPAHLIFRSDSVVLLDTLAEIRSRGNIRKVVCYMPPTKIRLDKGYLRSQGWLDYPTLKIVNSCSYSDVAESYVNVEHLIYQIYNLLTNKSFRTKSVTLTYRDSDGKKKPRTFDGFLIEHEDQLAHRVNGELISQDYFRPELLDRKSYLVFSMFQYLIGNTDWKVRNKHNLEIIKVLQEKSVYPVPYDFDYAGLINTTYAVPHERLPIKSVKERLYLGPCQTAEEVEDCRKLFISNKNAIYQLIEGAGLDEKQERSIRYYVDKFYEEIEDQRVAEMTFTNCVDY
ncbi:MAG: hypothetical protein HKN76_03130 [Saprospiraceae bacterium]|nr:hypothetical protein [Saprospiraceae bacterium]